MTAAAVLRLQAFRLVAELYSRVGNPKSARIIRPATVNRELACLKASLVLLRFLLHFR